MVVFQDIEDIVEWLEPLDYIAFWEAVQPWHLTLQAQEHCDDLIAAGNVEQGLILDGLKTMAKIELAQKLNLDCRIYHPVASAKH